MEIQMTFNLGLVLEQKTFANILGKLIFLKLPT